MAGKMKSFSEKHGQDAKPDPAIKEAILERTRTDELACAVAFDIAGNLKVEPHEVGKTADLMEYRLVKCQLGLFGYTPENTIVKPKEPENTQILAAIDNGMVNDRLPCITAWRIAKEFKVPKMTVSRACEARGIKIKPCQLGAF